MEERELLQARMADLSRKCYRMDILTHTGFLSTGEQSFPGGYPALSGTMEGVPWVLRGGFEDSERRVLAFLPDYMDEESFSEDEVIACIRVEAQGKEYTKALTHRDYLGALMGLGIERDQVGDILVTGEGAFLFVLRDMAGYIAENLREVGRARVSTEAIPCGMCTARPEKRIIEGSVASGRLDAVVSFVFHMSRQDAKEWIEREMVSVGGDVKKPSYELRDMDVVSVRGKGKFRYEGVLGTSRKGREITRVSLYV